MSYFALRGGWWYCMPVCAGYDFFMVHNHPSGDPKPSRADIEMTRKVKDAVAAVNITLHDHVIVSRGGHVSFKSEGLL